MSSLLAVMLVTQADQSSPSLAFVWPTRPQPTLRLDRPVYKREQSSQIHPILYSGKHHHRDHHGNRFVRRFQESNHPYDLAQSSSDETSSFGTFNQSNKSKRIMTSSSSGLNLGRDKPTDFDQQDNHLFYESHHSDSIQRSSTTKSTKRSSMPTTYLGFQPDEWADMLTPRIHGSDQNLSFKTPQGMLTGRKLELVIDALAIIAHPVLVNQKPRPHSSNPERSTERGRTRTRSGEKASPPQNSPNKKSQSPFLKPVLPNQPSTCSRTSSSDPPIPAPKDPNSLLDLNPALPTSSSSPSKPTVPAPISQLTRMMTPSITPVDPSSSATPARLFLHPRSSPSTRSNSSSPSPVALPSRVNMRERYNPIQYSPMCGFIPTAPTLTVDEQANPPLQSAHLIPLQSFTLALIIDTPPASHLSQHLEVYYKDVVLKLTAALKHLERESSYLTREVHLMMHKVTERRASYSSCRSTSQQKQQQEIDYISEFVQHNSNLARALTRIFEDLKALGSTSITLDGQLDLELLLHRELLDSNTVPENWLLANSVKTPTPETGDQDRFIHLESWKSLLLLEDPQVLIEQTAPGSLLRDFIAIIKPALTLSEYKFLLDTDSNTIAEMTDHLLYWRKAKLTDVITLRNSYQLTCPAHSETSPDTRIALAQLQQEFSATFPDLPHLVMILSLISQHSRQPFSSILPLLNPHLEKSESMAVLVWLLKRDLLLRERTHVRIKIDRQTKMKVALWEQEQKQQKGSDESMEEMTEEPHFHYSPNSPARNRVNQSSSTGVQVSASLPTDSRFVPPFSAANKKRSQMMVSDTTHHYHHDHDHDPAELEKSPQERDERASERSLMSVVQPSNVASRGSRVRPPVQAGSLTSIGSSSECSGEREYQRSRFRQQSVQSDFSGAGLSDAGHPQDGSDGTPLEGLILLSHKVDRLADSIIGNPAQASALEQKWLDEICADKADAHIRAFNSAFRFFNGRYALEEIVSRSGLSRKALNEVLNEFKPHLILLIHP